MGDSSMPDFPSGGLDLVQYLNLDGIMLQNKVGGVVLRFIALLVLLWHGPPMFQSHHIISHGCLVVRVRAVLVWAYSCTHPQQRLQQCSAVGCGLLLLTDAARACFAAVVQGTIIHEGKGPPIPVPKLEQQQEPGQSSQQEQQLQQQASPTAPTEEGSKRHRDKRHRQALQQGEAAVGSTRDRSRASKQQRQPEQVQQPGVSQPRPHPFYVKPRHVKKHFKVTTVDGWKLHLIRWGVL